MDWEVVTAGTGDYHVGDGFGPRSVAEAARHGLDIFRQRARQLTAENLERFDHVLVKDPDNYREARALASGQRQRAKVKLIMSYAHPGGNLAVPDPYWDDDGFAGVYETLARAVDGFAEAHPGGLPD